MDLGSGLLKKYIKFFWPKFELTFGWNGHGGNGRDFVNHFEGKRLSPRIAIL